MKFLLVLTICLTITGCSGKQTDDSRLINQQASLHAANALPFNPFQGGVISSFVNAKESTTSILYGNELATQHARIAPQQQFPAGSMLSLVTWAQQEDDHWFGAKVPA